jgi:hypothetical protein
MTVSGGRNMVVAVSISLRVTVWRPHRCTSLILLVFSSGLDRIPQLLWHDLRSADPDTYLDGITS